MANRKEILNLIAYNKGLAEFIFSLQDRWQEEKEYEDWAEYEKVMKKEFKDLFPMCSFCRAFNKPFGFSFEIPNTIYQYKVKGNAITIYELR